MASGDVKVQSAVHSLDQGPIATLIKYGMGAVIVLVIALLYLFVQFRGLENANAMDQAQIARNLAEGKGYTTKFIRPIALDILKKRAPESASALDLNQTPDFYQSPLNPYINSLPLRLMKSSIDMSPNDPVYVGDRLVATTSVLFFLLAAVVWFFVIRRLFDAKLAFFAILSVLLTDLLWKFSISGLPQMLVLFLFGCASYLTVVALAADEEEDQVTKMLGALAGAGAMFGLMTLAHGLSVWLFLGWLVFVAIYFRPRALITLSVVAAFILVVGPWMARNFQVSGNPFGLAVYDAFYDAVPHESYQRFLEVDISSTGTSLQGKIRANLVRQVEGIFGLLGLNIAAAAFFLSLMHRFRNRRAALFKWCVLSMWGFAFIGMCIFRGVDPLSENQFHALFIPAFAAFGFAFLFVLWGRMEIGGQLIRTLFAVGILFLCSIPMIVTLFMGQQGRMAWPPYVPPIINIFGDWFTEDEVIASDMPWAVAWYSQRLSLLIPDTVKTFNRIHDYEETKQKICGLYLTPISGNRELFSQMYNGPFKEWTPLLMRPPRTEGFPFRYFVALPINNECLIFADRDRWRQ